jgi:hypothetical protein
VIEALYLSLFGDHAGIERQYSPRRPSTSNFGCDDVHPGLIVYDANVRDMKPLELQAAATQPPLRH